MAGEDKPKTAKELLARVGDLPSLPQVVLKVVEMIESGKASAADVAKVMADDPAMTVKVLKLVNSAFYGVPGNPITSVTFAVSRMGFNEVKSLALSMGVLSAFDMSRGSLDHKEFWMHSLSTALCARLIEERSARSRGRTEENPYFVAGLLHDVGILVLDQYLPDVFAKVIKICQQQGAPLHELEPKWEAFGHQELGAALLEKWNLPPAIAAAVRYHHRPLQAPAELRHFAEVIYLANCIAVNSAKGLALEGLFENYDPAVVTSLGLSLDAINDIVQAAERETEKSEVFLSIVGV